MGRWYGLSTSGYCAGCARGERERARQDREWLEPSRRCMKRVSSVTQVRGCMSPSSNTVTEWENAGLSGSCARTVLEAAQRCGIGGLQA